MHPLSIQGLPSAISTGVSLTGSGAESGKSGFLHPSVPYLPYCTRKSAKTISLFPPGREHQVSRRAGSAKDPVHGESEQHRQRQRSPTTRMIGPFSTAMLRSLLHPLLPQLRPPCPLCRSDPAPCAGGHVTLRTNRPSPGCASAPTATPHPVQAGQSGQGCVDPIKFPLQATALRLQLLYSSV